MSASASKVFLFFVLAFLAGIFVHSFWQLELRWILAFALGATSLAALFSRKRGVLALWLLAISAALGMARHEARVQQQDSSVFLQAGAFEGVVVEDPVQKQDSIQIIVEVRGERMLVQTSRFQEIQYGDFVRVEANVERPPVFEDFDYRAFLAKDGVEAVAWRADVAVQERGLGNPVVAALLRLKHRLREVLWQRLAPPESTVAAALVLGDKHLIEGELGQGLNRAGVRHMTAISGMHIALVAALLLSAFLAAGLRRRPAGALALAFVFLFVALTGFQTSALRAGAMGGMYITANLAGRKAVSLRQLLYAAAAMLALNPMLLRYDVGFQLSFLAVLGIVLLLPFLKQRLSVVPKRFGISEVAGMTIAAQAFTFPVLFLTFGSVSLVSVFSNLLAAPALPLLMVSGFAFLAAGLVSEPLGLLAAVPFEGLLHYFLLVVRLFSSLPFAVFSGV